MKNIVIFIFILLLPAAVYGDPTKIDFNIDGCYTGAVVSWKTVDDGNPWVATLADIKEFEKIVDRKLAIVAYYKAFSWAGVPYPFPKDFYATAKQNGSILLLTWEPRDWDTTSPYYYNTSMLPEIVAGKYDAYIDQWVNDIKALDRLILLRFAPEMNVNNFSWSGFMNGGGATGPATYVKAYRYVHDRFKAAGVSNVQWVWTPIKWGLPFEPWNHYSNYYPGAEYVDVVAMDEYNWGTSQPWSKWSSFNESYWQLYSELTHLYPDKPLILGEFASSGQGGDKAKWIADAFNDLKEKYPMIKAFVWFQNDNRGQIVNNLAENTDWRINSSPECAAAARKALSGKYFVDQIKSTR